MTPINVKTLAQQSLTCTERLKGKARDAAILEFWKGSALILDQLKHPDYARVANITAYLVAIRGVKEVERLAKELED